MLGSGAIPLAGPRDYARLVATAASGDAVAFTNNRYSADVVAVGRADLLAAIPAELGDNALPRWLERRGVEVRDARATARLQVDVDSPADALLLGGRVRLATRAAARLGLVDAGAALLERLAGVRSVVLDPGSELLVAGRTSARTLGWLERRVPARVRALVEERGMRTAPPAQRPPASVLGLVLDMRGPDGLAGAVARLADAAVIDTRVLIAHHAGRDEQRWPSAEDRFASDLLLAGRIDDPWLRALTTSAADSPLPVLLGGHTLVGPGLPRILAPAGGRR